MADPTNPVGLEDVTPDDTREYFEELVGTTGHEIDPDGVNHPAHYNMHPSGVECIDIIEHMSFNVGTAVKYLWRDGLKDQHVPDQDLRKALWYLERELQRRAQ